MQGLLMIGASESVGLASRSSNETMNSDVSAGPGGESRRSPGSTESPDSNEGDRRAEEAGLVLRVRSGEQDAFEILYRRYASGILSLTYRMVRDRAEAEDLTQEVFIQAYRRLDSFEGRSKFGTWLYRIAVRKTLDHLKSRRSKEQQRNDPIADRLADPVPVDSGGLDLEKAIATLSPSSKAAFMLNKVEGYDYREVSEIMGIAVGTAKSLVHRARMRLRERLLETGPASEGNSHVHN